MLVVQKHLVSELSSCCTGPLSSDTQRDGGPVLTLGSRCPAQALRPSRVVASSGDAVGTTWPDSWLFFPEGDVVCVCWWGVALSGAIGFLHVGAVRVSTLSSSGKSSD